MTAFQKQVAKQAVAAFTRNPISKEWGKPNDVLYAGEGDILLVFHTPYNAVRTFRVTWIPAKQRWTVA